VDEQVEPTVERLAYLAHDTLDVLVGPNVARGDERTGDGVREFSDALLGW
jgi:hypothetical protein